MGPGRVQTHVGHMQTGPVCAEMGPSCRWVQKVRKLWKAISHSKHAQIGCLRCFLASTRNVNAKNTSKAQFGEVLSEIWPPEVFRSQNSCGQAQRGPVRAQTGPIHAQMDPSHTQMHAGHTQTGSKSLENFGRSYLTQNLSKSGV